LQRLTILLKNHADEQYIARRSLRELPGTVARLSELLSGLAADMATAAAHAADPVRIGDRTVPREDATAVLGEQLDSLPRAVRETQRVALGTYRGLRFGMVLNPHFGPEAYLEGATTRRDTLSRDHHGPRALLNALDRLANAYEAECARVRQDLAIAESQLRDYQTRLGAPFPHASYLSDLTALRDQLKAGLSGAGPNPDGEPHPVAEVAERIKALKAANVVEAAPQRIGKRRGSAEEPVTARIRRKLEAVLAPEPSPNPMP